MVPRRSTTTGRFMKQPRRNPYLPERGGLNRATRRLRMDQLSTQRTIVRNLKYELSLLRSSGASAAAIRKQENAIAKHERDVLRLQALLDKV